MPINLYLGLLNCGSENIVQNLQPGSPHHSNNDVTDGEGCDKGPYVGGD